MQLVVVCAGCGAKYTGQSGAKKYKCRTCSNIFTFPERPQSPPGGTVLCSNCWNATAINDQISKCQFCFQKLTNAHSGSASAAAGSTGSRAMTAMYPNENPRPTGRISTPHANRADTRDDIVVSGTVPLPTHAIPGATQEAVMDLQRGLEEAMSEFVEPKESRTQAMRRRIDEDARRQQDNKVLELEQRLAIERAEKEKAMREIEELEDSHRKLEDKLHESDMRRPSDPGTKFHTPIPEEDAEEMRQHETKIAELTALLSAEKKQREVFGQERDQLKGQMKEIGARFAELNTQLAQEAVMRENVQRERDQLLDARHDDDSRVGELEASLKGILAMKDALEKERDELSKKGAQQSEAAELEEILNSERTARHKLETKVAELEAQIASGGPAELPTQYDTRNMSTDVLELQARVADLKKRLKTEIGAKDALKRERDEAISRAEAAEYELSNRPPEPAPVPTNGSSAEHSGEYDQIFETLADRLKQALSDATKKHRRLCGNENDSGVLTAEPADENGDEIISSPVEMIEIPDAVAETAAAAPLAEERLEVVSAGPVDVPRRSPTGTFRAPPVGPPTVMVAPETAVIGLRPNGDSEPAAPAGTRQPSSRFLGRLLGR